MAAVKNSRRPEQTAWMSSAGVSSSRWRRCSTSAYTMRTAASVDPAMLMEAELIAVFYFALRLSDKRKNG